MTDDLTLYFFPRSTASQKVRLCQFHKGLRFKEIIVDLVHLAQLDPAYMEIHPKAQVPALVAGGTPITEASIINEYLEERFPEAPLMPREPALRAHVRAWNKYVDAQPTVKIAVPTFRAWIAPGLAGLPKEELLAQVSRAPDEGTRTLWQRTVRGEITDEDVAQAFRVVDDMLARMEALLARGPWLFGDAYSLADVETLPLVVRVQHLGRTDMLAARPRVSAWLERATALPNFAQTYAFLQDMPRG